MRAAPAAPVRVFVGELDVLPNSRLFACLTCGCVAFRPDRGAGSSAWREAVYLGVLVSPVLVGAAASLLFARRLY
jgi:hypothetical protein